MSAVSNGFPTWDVYVLIVFIPQSLAAMSIVMIMTSGWAGRWAASGQVLSAPNLSP